MKKEVYVTAKGAELKCNSWEVGQKVSMSIQLADHFIENGLVSEALETEIEVKPKTKKKN